MSKANRTIMVVDDEPDILKLVEISLKLSDYTVVSALNGPQALDMIKTQAPDLILLDIMMPEMSGYEVYQALKADEQMKKLPVVFFTAKGQAKDIEKGRAMGVEDYIVKPFDPYELGERIERLLNK